MADPIRILLAEDHHIVRAGLRHLIETEADLRIVGEASDGETACRLADELLPDMVIMDLSMPGIGGARATEQITRALPDVKVIILTVHEDRGYLRIAFQAGASGYVLKRAAADELILAIRAVKAGGTYLAPSIAGGVLQEYTSPASETANPAKLLSEREALVFKLIARGFSNKEIAAKLDLSTKTIETYKARSIEKLGIRSRSEIVSYASKLGWLDD